MGTSEEERKGGKKYKGPGHKIIIQAEICAEQTEHQKYKEKFKFITWKILENIVLVVPKKVPSNSMSN